MSDWQSIENALNETETAQIEEAEQLVNDEATGKKAELRVDDIIVLDDFSPETLEEAFPGSISMFQDENRPILGLNKSSVWISSFTDNVLLLPDGRVVILAGVIKDGRLVTDDEQEVDHVLAITFDSLRSLEMLDTWWSGGAVESAYIQSDGDLERPDLPGVILEQLLSEIGAREIQPRYQLTPGHVSDPERFGIFGVTGEEIVSRLGNGESVAVMAPRPGSVRIERRSDGTMVFTVGPRYVQQQAWIVRDADGRVYLVFDERALQESETLVASRPYMLGETMDFSKYRSAEYDPEHRKVSLENLGIEFASDTNLTQVAQEIKQFGESFVTDIDGNRWVIKGYGPDTTGYSVKYYDQKIYTDNRYLSDENQGIQVLHAVRLDGLFTDLSEDDVFIIEDLIDSVFYGYAVGEEQVVGVVGRDQADTLIFQYIKSHGGLVYDGELVSVAGITFKWVHSYLRDREIDGAWGRPLILLPGEGIVRIYPKTSGGYILVTDSIENHGDNGADGKINGVPVAIAAEFNPFIVQGYESLQLPIDALVLADPSYEPKMLVQIPFDASNVYSTIEIMLLREDIDRTQSLVEKIGKLSENRNDRELVDIGFIKYGDMVVHGYAAVVLDEHGEPTVVFMADLGNGKSSTQSIEDLHSFVKTMASGGYVDNLGIDYLTYYYFQIDHNGRSVQRIGPLRGYVNAQQSYKDIADEFDLDDEQKKQLESGAWIKVGEAQGLQALHLPTGVVYFFFESPDAATGALYTSSDRTHLEALERGWFDAHHEQSKHVTYNTEQELQNALIELGLEMVEIGQGEGPEDIVKTVFLEKIGDAFTGRIITVFATRLDSGKYAMDIVLAEDYFGEIGTTIQNAYTDGVEFSTRVIVHKGTLPTINEIETVIYEDATSVSEPEQKDARGLIDSPATYVDLLSRPIPSNIRISIEPVTVQHQTGTWTSPSAWEWNWKWAKDYLEEHALQGVDALLLSQHTAVRVLTFPLRVLAWFLDYPTPSSDGITVEDIVLVGAKFSVEIRQSVLSFE